MRSARVRIGVVSNRLQLHQFQGHRRLQASAWHSEKQLLVFGVFWMPRSFAVLDAMR